MNSLSGSVVLMVVMTLAPEGPGLAGAPAGDTQSGWKNDLNQQQTLT